jgi:hypothetical protein
VSSWYVVGKEPAEGDDYVSVFGPFVSESDARAFALDEAEDNGWESIVAVFMDHNDAEELATDHVLWPYNEEQEGED